MQTWNIWLHLLYRTPGILIWVIFLAAAFLLHRRSPRQGTTVLVGAGIVALLATIMSIVGDTMLQIQLRQPNPQGETLSSRVQLLQTILLGYQVAALVFAISLLGVLRSEKHSPNDQA